MSAGGIFGFPGRTRTSDPAVNRRQLRDLNDIDGASGGIRTAGPRMTNGNARYCAGIHSSTRESAGGSPPRKLQ
jgi:hypothetical protein